MKFQKITAYTVQVTVHNESCELLKLQLVFGFLFRLITIDFMSALVDETMLCMSMKLWTTEKDRFQIFFL